MGARKSTISKIDDVVRKEALEAKEHAESDLAVLREFSIEDQDDMEFAAQELAEVKGYKNAWKEKLQGFVNPLNKVLSDIRELLNPPIDYYSEIEKLWKQKIKEANARVFEEQQRALHEAAQASKDGDDERAETALERASNTGFTPIKGLSTSATWDFEVEDFDEVPVEYLVVDESRVKAVIRAHKGNIAIPGIKILKKTSVRSRSA